MLLTKNDVGEAYSQGIEPPTLLPDDACGGPHVSQRYAIGYGRLPDSSRRVHIEANADSGRPLTVDVSETTNEAFLDDLQRAAFGYFLEAVNPANGLIADSSHEGSPSSIAVVGFALSAYPVAVERGWMARADAGLRTRAALHFFYESDQSGAADATGWKGFYYHFLDMSSGRRVWQSELSLIDTALLDGGRLDLGGTALFHADSLSIGLDAVILKLRKGLLCEHLQFRGRR
jgi:hypothetical protein